MRDRIEAWLAIAGCIALAACAQNTTAKPPSPAATPITSGTISENVATVRATVEKIDHKTRHVTLRREDGSEMSFRADDSVKRLDQVDPGDVVVAKYYQSLAYRLL